METELNYSPKTISTSINNEINREKTTTNRKEIAAHSNEPTQNQFALSVWRTDYTYRILLNAHYHGISKHTSRQTDEGTYNVFEKILYQQRRASTTTRHALEGLAYGKDIVLRE